MFDIIVDHALKNAWCSPRQDLQVILKPKRVSNPRGIKRITPHLWGSIPLPTTSDRYHLYQVGQYHPAFLGLVPTRRVWHRLSRMMEVENLVADVYTNTGRQLARFETWVLVTEERNVLIAIRDQPRIANLKTEPVYVRLYSNTFFASDRADDFNHRIVCRGKRFETVNDVPMFQQAYRDYAALPGQCRLFINGIYVHDYSPANFVAGDTMEFVYDSTVKRVVDLPVSALTTFTSAKDAKQKYLLHYDGAQTGGEIIDYRDDIDVYLVKKTVVGGETLFDGLYYHKNSDDALRMVTHRDYSIAVPYVVAYQTSKSNWATVNELTVRLVIRQAGYARPLINEHNRIKELYKLGDHARHQALTGTDSSLEIWQAPNLENSKYPVIMDSEYSAITNQMVQDAYGYNAIGKLLADSPMPVEVVHGRRQISLPYGLQLASTMFEYNAAGKLLGFYYHTSGAEYVPFNAATTLVEGIVGRGSYKLTTLFDTQTAPIDPLYSYRFYAAPKPGGVPNLDAWEDVTGDESKVVVIGGVATWLLNRLNFAVAVRSDKDFLCYDLTLSPINGLLKFTIDGASSYPSVNQQGVMKIPPGKIDVFLNGMALIEDLDYFVRWPQVVIVNKAHLVPGNTQKVTVRGTGFCKPDLTREAPAEFGFVQFGLMSRNNKFDIRDDKVMRMVVNGATIHRDVLIFSEDDSGVRMDNVPNGAPYVVEDVVVPMRGVTQEDTYVLRELSREVDAAVSDYLTLKLPEPAHPDVNPSPAYYAIYSPFLSTIMYDMMNGVLSTAGFEGQYSDMDVSQYLEDYTYLLDYDPTQMDHIDLNFVSIHPHNLLTETEVNIYQRRFLERVVKVFLDDRVDLSRFVALKSSWL